MSAGHAAGVVLLACAIVLDPGDGRAHDDGPAVTPSSAVPRGRAETAVKISIPDLLVLDQDGREVRLYSDLVKGKTVAINVIYTSCTTTCPLLAATFAKVQDLIGERLGRELALVSISADPTTDTPERLKAWSAKFDARPGWTLVTGRRPVIAAVLRALGVSLTQPEAHPPLVIVGNVERGHWTRRYALVQPATLATLMEGMTRETTR